MDKYDNDDDDDHGIIRRSATLDSKNLFFSFSLFLFHFLILSLSGRITDLIAEHATRASRSSAGEAQPSQGIRLLSCLLSKLTLPFGTQGGAANCELILTSR